MLRDLPARPKPPSARRRKWTASGEIPLLEGGFLLSAEYSERRRQTARNQTATLRELADLDGVPCLILLGPPGLGKSVELRAEHERLKAAAAGGSAGVLHVDLKRHGESSLRSAVFEAEEYRRWACGEAALTLLLDSLDECWPQVGSLIPLLTGRLASDGLGREGRQPLSLRLGCRSAEWRSGETSRLRELFGDPEGKAGKVQVHQLCPLARDDVARIAAERGVTDIEAFFAAVDRLELGALAAHPLTLNLLIEDAKAGRPIGPTRAKVYRRGLGRLAEDDHEEAAGTPRNPRTQVARRRYHIAARVAAVGVLSCRYHCRLPNGRSEGEASPPALEVVDLCESEDQGEVNVMRDPLALAETYRCGIFSAAGEGRVTWQHQAYAEFLAAEHLSGTAGRREPISTRDLLGLVADVSPAAPKIYPPLEELALWLVEMRPDLFEALLPGNAELLLRADPHTLTPERRERIVANYFAQIRAHEAEGEDWEKRLPLERLAHPRLADQVRAVLVDRQEPTTLRRTVIAIAAACELRELTDDLVERAFDPAEEVGVADRAAARLHDWARASGAAGAEVRAQVRARMLAVGGFRRDELRGIVLSMLWPGDLSVDELVPHLTPPDNSNRLGSYELFLYQSLPAKALDEQVAPLLRWAVVKKLRGNRHLDHRIDAVQKLARRAFDSEDSEMQGALVELALCWCDYEWPDLFEVARDQKLEPTARRRFIAKWLPRLPLEKRELSHFGEASCPILDHDDLGWVIEQALAATDLDAHGRWSALAGFLFRRESQQDVETVWPLVERSAEFAEWVRAWTSCRIDVSEEENWRKRTWRGEQAEIAHRAKKPTLEASLDKALHRYEAGTLPAFFAVMEGVCSRDGEGGMPAQEWTATVVDQVSPEIHARVAQAAKDYWVRCEVAEVELRKTEVVFHKYHTAVRALAYLMHREPEWLVRQDAAWWEKWLLVFFRHQDWLIGERQELWAGVFGLAHAVAPATFVRALAVWLEIESKAYVDSALFAGGRLLTEPAVRAVLRTRVQERANRHEGNFQLAGTLLEAGDAEFEAWLARVMTLRDERQCDRRAPFAAAVLLTFKPQTYGARIAEEFTRDEAWARAVLWRMNGSGDLPVDWVSVLAPDLVARLWEALVRMVPNDPWEGGGGTWTFGHDLSRLGSHLLNHLDRQHSPDAVAAVEALLQRHPGRANWLGRMLARVRRARRREEWQPLPPEKAAAYLDGYTSRPLATVGDLCDAVLTSLASYQAWLKGPNHTAELWNQATASRRFWDPKDENEVSTCLLNHLQRELGPQGVVVTREEETLSGTATDKANYPDLVVRAPNPADAGKYLHLYVEVKCAWNIQAITGLGDQLLGRYLRTAECGIYLLAHPACATWDAPNDSRRKKPLIKAPKPKVAEMLRAELARLRETTGKRIEAFFLDSGLGVENAEAETRNPRSRASRPGAKGRRRGESLRQ